MQDGQLLDARATFTRNVNGAVQVLSDIGSVGTGPRRRYSRQLALDGSVAHPYRVSMVSAPRSFYAYSYYYGYPETGRSWRRTRD